MESDKKQGSTTGVLSAKSTEKYLYPLLRHNFRCNAYMEYSEVLNIVLEYAGVQSEREFEQAYSLPTEDLHQEVSKVNLKSLA